MATDGKQGGKADQAMEIYRKLGAPGAPHKQLAGMEGSWSTRIKTWMGPDSPPMESRGTSEQKMLLGGRFLQQVFTSEMMGGYSGIGFTGYDNHTKKYVSTWMDSMSTGLMVFEGTAGADGKTITQTSRYDDPVRGPMQWRTMTRIVDDNTFLFEMYGTYKGSKEEKMMEITYTRK
ncbi:MAG TPA: DUF1579 domain-containing protein [Syntrophales bacterium]|nr:DUF1579 domain-containing protein [Syntrophales bacterium]